MELGSSSFLPFGEIKTQRSLKNKIINDGGIHLMVGPIIYIMCLSLSKLCTSFILLNGDDPNPFFKALSLDIIFSIYYFIVSFGWV